MAKRPPTIADRIMRRARARGRGHVFVPGDFDSLGPRRSIGRSLSKLVNAGLLRQIGKGIYEYPRLDPLGGHFPPSADAVAKAISRKDGIRIQAEGSRVANALGLSTQVPAKRRYLTDGRSRHVDLGSVVVSFRHEPPQNLVAPGTKAGAIFQALRFLGPTRADRVPVVASRILSARDKSVLAKSAANAPEWMRPTLLEIAGSGAKVVDG